MDYKGVVELLNLCLKTVMGWLRANKLKLNSDKMDVLLVGSSCVLGSGCTLRFAGVVLTP